MTSVVCPSCGSPRIRIVGQIPPSTTFAGNVVETMPADLVLCRVCRLGFRHPQPSHEQLVRLYESGSDSAWSETGAERQDWKIATGLIARIGAASVLDIGCFDGGFLSGLPSGVDKVGVEIHPGAAQRAQERGVRVVAADLYELNELDERFDCVVAFDVIEHVHDPRRFLTELVSAVRPGGHVIIATGNIETPTRRFMGSRYLYSWFQEHIAFVSPRWTRSEASRLGLSVVETIRFSHTSGGLLGYFGGFVKNAAYKAAPGAVQRARVWSLATASPLERALSSAPPAWTAAKDHFVVLLRKDD
jgi:SAM-dependent methyltransferase